MNSLRSQRYASGLTGGDEIFKLPKSKAHGPLFRSRAGIRTCPVPVCIARLAGMTNAGAVEKRTASEPNPRPVTRFPLEFGKDQSPLSRCSQHVDRRRIMRTAGRLAGQFGR